MQGLFGGPLANSSNNGGVGKIPEPLSLEATHQLQPPENTGRVPPITVLAPTAKENTGKKQEQ